MSAPARAASRAVADVPFASPRHQVVVRVKLGKQGPFSMLLDTGSAVSAIDAALARRLRPSADTARREGAATGAEPAAFEWNLRDLRLGSLRADSVPAVALDLGKISESLGLPLGTGLGLLTLRGLWKRRWRNSSPQEGSVVS